MKNILNSKQLNKNPYKGIYAEVAKEEGTSRQNIRQAVLLGNLRVAEIVMRKIKERKSKSSRLSRELQEC